MCIKLSVDESRLLEEAKFGKKFPKIISMLENKSVVICGQGVFLEYIIANFALESLNFLGVIEYEKLNGAAEHKRIITEEFKYLNKIGFSNIDDISNVVTYDPDYVLITSTSESYQYEAEKILTRLRRETKNKFKIVCALEFPFNLRLQKAWSAKAII